MDKSREYKIKDGKAFVWIETECWSHPYSIEELEILEFKIAVNLEELKRFQEHIDKLK